MKASLKTSVAMVAALVGLGLFAAPKSAAKSSADTSFVLGSDISWVTEFEKKGRVFKTASGESRDLFRLLKEEYSHSAVRLRVWVNPKDKWCDKDDTVAKALRAKAAGMDVMVDFHYSDNWADPGHQHIPAAWAPYSNDVAKVASLLAAHTRDVLGELKRRGVEPKWIQVGNETAPGFVWPTGSTSRPDGYAALFKAGYAAAKKVFPNAIVIIHLDRGHNHGLYDWNLGMLAERGVKWDMIGMSVYPYWVNKDDKQVQDRVITQAMSNIRRLAAKYGTDVMIVETGVHNRTGQPEVQKESLRQLQRILFDARHDTDNHCRGVFYWEPDSYESPYQLGAFRNDGRPTEIMDAFNTYDRK